MTHCTLLITSESPGQLGTFTVYKGLLAYSRHHLNVGGIPVSSDVFLFEKQQTFNRSKIVERHVHACGSGAFGYFETTADVSRLCKAQFLKGMGTKTPVFVRFSTVTYGREFPHEARDPRGFAIKFYTGDGNVSSPIGKGLR